MKSFLILLIAESKLRSSAAQVHSISTHTTPIKLQGIDSKRSSAEKKKEFGSNGDIENENENHHRRISNGSNNDSHERGKSSNINYDGDDNNSDNEQNISNITDGNDHVNPFKTVKSNLEHDPKAEPHYQHSEVLNPARKAQIPTNPFLGKWNLDLDTRIYFNL